MNLTRLKKERKKERKESERRGKRRKTGKNKIPNVVGGVGALSLEIRTGNCFESITL